MFLRNAKLNPQLPNAEETIFLQIVNILIIWDFSYSQRHMKN